MDPIIFEVLRHRLTSIVDEAAATLANLSGSPSVAQSNDCNVVLLTPTGEGVIMGKAMATHAISCVQTARYVLDNYQSNPGINDGDMFLTNHPYIGTPHQPCIVLIAPVFQDGQMIAWAGAGNHMGDVGGRVPGQVTIGARSIWDEPVPVPPIRIVEGGILRRDLEDEFLTRSRTRAQNSLDLRAMIGANNTISQRLTQVVGRYGHEQIDAAMQSVIDTSETKLRSILSEIPDGSWVASSYLDYYDDGLEIYDVNLTMTKEGDDLVFDFRESSPQAAAVVNATFVATEGYVFRALLALFGFAISHCPAAIQRVVRVVTREGSVVDCRWPAGVCKGTTSATQSVLQASTGCLSQMLLSSDKYRGRAMAVSRGHLMILDAFGEDQYGEPFASVVQDCAQAAGSGALSTGDGIDTGGVTDPRVGIPNVENTELRYPLLYLYRRQRRDSGGAGKYRGGVGLSMAVTPHDAPGIPDIMIHTHGVIAPSAKGLSGGLPGTTNRIVIKRDADLAEAFSRGALPVGPDALEGRTEVPQSFAHTRLGERDVLFCAGSGGGGYGDPLDRDPEAVAADIVALLVSAQAARDQYGVGLHDDGSVDGHATEELRRSLKLARRKEGLTRHSLSVKHDNPGAASGQWVSEYLRLNERDSEATVQCQCGAILGSPDTFMDNLAKRVDSPSVMPDAAESASTQFSMTEYFCPSCFTLVETEIELRASQADASPV